MVVGMLVEEATDPEVGLMVEVAVLEVEVRAREILVATLEAEVQAARG